MQTSKSDADQQVLDFVGDYWTRHYYAPTLREIADGVEGLSFRGARAAIERLRDEGRVTYGEGKGRTIRVVDGLFRDRSGTP